MRAAKAPAAALSVAVVGTGSIGMRHLKALGALPGARPIALPKRPERARELARSGLATAGSVEEAARLGAKACIIASDTARHAQDASAALKAGMDVLVEKPLAVSAEEARGICGLAEARGRRAFVGCVLRFSRTLSEFRKLLPKLGSLHHVRVECQSYLPDWRPERPYLESYSARAGEGGVLRDLIHEIDYAGWLFGWPGALSAHARNLGRLGIEAEESADLLWELPAGGTLSMHLDYLSRPARRLLRADGERGTLAWDGVSGALSVELEGAGRRVIESVQGKDEMLSAQARAFLGSLSGRADERLAAAEDGLRALAVCDAARRSAAEGKRVEVRT